MPRLSMKLLHSACDAYEHTCLLTVAIGSKTESAARRLQRAGLLMETGISAMNDLKQRMDAKRSKTRPTTFIHFVPTLVGLYQAGRLARWPTRRRRKPPTRNVKAG